MPLLLAGVAVGMFLGAVTSGLLTFMNEQKVQEYLFWIVGGLDYRRWEHVYMAAGPILAGAAVMVLLARQLNILALGEQEARAVGMRVLPLRMGLLLLASLTQQDTLRLKAGACRLQLRIRTGEGADTFLPVTGYVGEAQKEGEI